MANITNRPDLVVTLLIIGIAMSGFQYGSGFLVNAVDIAPRYAGIIMAMSNAVASLCGYLAPFAVGIITESVSKTGSFSNGKCVAIYRIQIHIRYDVICSINVLALYSVIYHKGNLSVC